MSHLCHSQLHRAHCKWAPTKQAQARATLYSTQRVICYRSKHSIEKALSSIERALNIVSKRLFLCFAKEPYIPLKELCSSIERAIYSIERALYSIERSLNIVWNETFPVLNPRTFHWKSFVYSIEKVLHSIERALHIVKAPWILHQRDVSCAKESYFRLKELWMIHRKSPTVHWKSPKYGSKRRLLS
jgi:hypothetical protein